MGKGNGNSAVEGAAIAYVIEQERLHGRSARDTRGRGAADVESDGRIIEVKAYGDYWTSGVLYFTPSQLRHGERNPNYYVYIVENLTQGDPSKFDLRVLHGADLQRLFAGAKPHRSYVPVRAGDQARLTRIGAGAWSPPQAPIRLTVPKLEPGAKGIERSDLDTPAQPGSLRERDVRYGEFLGSILDEAKQREPHLTNASRVRARSFYYLAAGRAGFLIGVLFSAKGFNVELYINPKPRERNKAFFDTLCGRKVDIERAIGCPLEWERLDDREGSRIVARRAGATISDPTEELDELRTWAVAMLIRFVHVFRPIIRELG